MDDYAAYKEENPEEYTGSNEESEEILPGSAEDEEEPLDAEDDALVDISQPDIAFSSFTSHLTHILLHSFITVNLVSGSAHFVLPSILATFTLSYPIQQSYDYKAFVISLSVYYHWVYRGFYMPASTYDRSSFSPSHSISL